MAVCNLFLQGQQFREFFYLYRVNVPYSKFAVMRFLLFFFMLAPLMIMAQSIVPLAAGDLPDANIGAMNTYGIESILEYNEDAGVMVEYGFQALMVQEIKSKGATVKVEVYQMSSPEAAYGIFTVSVLKCKQRDTLTPYDCNGVFQYQAAYGNLYIGVSSTSGSTSAQSLYIPAAMAVMQKNPQQLFQLPEPFNQPLMVKGRRNLAYVRGMVALQNLPIPYQELFAGVGFNMYSIVLVNADSDYYFARIGFETPDSQSRFKELAGFGPIEGPSGNTSTNNGIYREYRQVDYQTIYFLQSQEPWPISAVVQPE